MIALTATRRYALHGINVDLRRAAAARQTQVSKAHLRLLTNFGTD